jgi:hypothetical protein
MSAVRDQNQNTTFIFSNFYHIYRKSKLEAQLKNELAKGVVLKSSELSTAKEVEEFSIWSHGETQAGKREMASHLRSLREARKRLHYMMQELDSILKQS